MLFRSRSPDPWEFEMSDVKKFAVGGNELDSSLREKEVDDLYESIVKSYAFSDALEEEVEAYFKDSLEI